MAVTPLVPELLVTDIDRSLAFYRDVVGFSVRYERPEEGFAFVEREGAQLMLERYDPSGWVTGPMEPPFGRGISFEISVADVDALHDAVVASGNALFRSLHEAWYRAGDLEVGNRQFLVQDPDGYLLRFAADLGTRPPATTSATEPRLSLGADGPNGEPVGQVRLATESDHGAMARLRWTWRVDMGEERHR